MTKYLLLMMLVTSAHASDRPGGGGQGCSLDGQGFFLASVLREDIALDIAATLSSKLAVDSSSVKVHLGAVTEFTTSFNVSGTFSLQDGRRFSFLSIDRETGKPAPISYYGKQVLGRRDPDGRPIGKSLRCSPTADRSSVIAIVDPSGNTVATFGLGYI